MDLFRIEQQHTGLLAKGARVRLLLLSPLGLPLAQIDGLIDTGADRTCFGREQLERLGYARAGTTLFVSNSSVEEVPLYNISLQLPDHRPVYNVDLQVAGLPHVAWRGGAFTLVGRDLLDLGQFHYDGPNDVFHLDLSRQQDG